MKNIVSTSPPRNPNATPPDGRSEGRTEVAEMSPSKQDLRGSQCCNDQTTSRKRALSCPGPGVSAASPGLGKFRGVRAHLGSTEFQEESAKWAHSSTPLAGRQVSLCELHLLSVTVLGLGVVLLLAVAAWRQWRQNKLWREGALRASGHRCC